MSRNLCELRYQFNHLTNYKPCMLSSHQTSSCQKDKYELGPNSEFGETFVYFSQMKRYLRFLKNIQFCELWYPIFNICIRRGTNIAIEASVRTKT